MRKHAILVLLVLFSFQMETFCMIKNIKGKMGLRKSGGSGGESSKAKTADSGEGSITRSDENWKASDLPDSTDNHWLRERLVIQTNTRAWLVAGSHARQAQMYPHPLHLIPFLNRLKLLYEEVEPDDEIQSLFPSIERAIKILREQDLTTQKAQEAVASFFAVLALITGIGKAPDVALTETDKTVRRWLQDDECNLKTGLLQLVGNNSDFKQMHDSLIYLWDRRAE